MKADALIAALSFECIRVWIASVRATTALSAGTCPSGKLLMYDGASCELEAGLYHGGAGLVSQSH